VTALLVEPDPTGPVGPALLPGVQDQAGGHRDVDAGLDELLDVVEAVGADGDRRAPAGPPMRRPAESVVVVKPNVTPE
jgi:hypothetical protein